MKAECVVYTHVGTRVSGDSQVQLNEQLPALRAQVVQRIDTHLRSEGFYPTAVIATPGVQVIPQDHAFPANLFPPVLDAVKLFKLHASLLLDGDIDTYLETYVEDKDDAVDRLIEQVCREALDLDPRAITLNGPGFPPEITAFCEQILREEAIRAEMIEEDDVPGSHMP